MWKSFTYSGRQRVAYISPEGPAFQVLDCGEVATGFRSFNKDKMKNVASYENRFDLIPPEVIEDYPELKLAAHL